MMKKLICILILSSMELLAQKLTLSEMSAVVWSQDQTIKGNIESFTPSSVELYLNGKPQPVQLIQDSLFSVQVRLGEGINTIYLKAVNNKGVPLLSDTLRLILGYKLHPEVYAYAEVSNRTVTLVSQLISNPDSAGISYTWSEDGTNPMTGTLNASSGENVSFTMPQNAPSGEYYYNLRLLASDGDTIRARTYVTVDSSGLRPFNIKTDHAEWIDKAVIYEVTPYLFVNRGKFTNITAKIPELAQFGITTIWLQPVYPTHGGGQGYDVMDYFSVRSDLGTEADLKELIRTAKSYGLRVIFDFVANHSSIYHPYAQNSKQYREKSHYWDFYQRSKSPVGTPYLQNENSADGLFWNYFWAELPNLNYDNPEVQRWMLEAMKYWVGKFDIDGYRFDAIWGVNARKPEFTKQLRLTLKRIKPEILLLAEDKAPWASVFDERFDMAFDWAESQSWVSQWVWQTSYSQTNSPTIFNSSSSVKSVMLRNSLTNYGKGYSPRAKILRFLENNDTYHFINDHTLEQTKMAAALEFSLNGVPLIYNGQEIGIAGHAYSTEFYFYPGLPMRSRDQKGLYPYYKRLVQLRKSIPAFYSDNYEEEKVSPGNANVFAFRRWTDRQNVFTVINMDAAPVSASLTIPVEKLNLDTLKTYYLTDMLNGSKLSGTLRELNNVQLAMDAYSTRMFLLADTVMTVAGVGQSASNGNVPHKFELAQNYPNPFNPSTVIKFYVAESGPVSLRVYDMLGREVETLIDGFKTTGEYSAVFNGQKYSSGIYIYRLQSKGEAMTRKMVLIK